MACRPSSPWLTQPQGAPPPSPPAGRARVVVDHALARPGGGSSLSRRQARFSCSLCASWRGHYRCRCSVTTALYWIWFFLGGSTIRQKPSPLPTLSPSWCRGLLLRLSRWAPPVPPVSQPLLHALVSSPPSRSPRPCLSHHVLCCL